MLQISYQMQDIFMLNKSDCCSTALSSGLIISQFQLKIVFKTC